MANTKIEANYNLIKYQMKEQGMKTSDLAELLNCSEQAIYNMLTKKTVPSYTERMILICYALKLDPREVFEINF